MNNATLLELTKDMPCKTIEVNGKPYLQRHFAGTTVDDYDVFVHRFLSADGDEHLHSHPRDSYSLPLVGGYLEETSTGKDWCMQKAIGIQASDVIAEVIADPLSMYFKDCLIRKCSRHITVFDWHRIAEVKPETWSLFIVGPEILPYWHFKNGDEVEAVKSSPRNWWQSYGPRSEQ